MTVEAGSMLPGIGAVAQGSLLLGDVSIDGANIDIVVVDNVLQAAAISPSLRNRQLVCPASDAAAPASGLEVLLCGTSTHDVHPDSCARSLGESPVCVEDHGPIFGPFSPDHLPSLPLEEATSGALLVAGFDGAIVVSGQTVAKDDGCSAAIRLFFLMLPWLLPLTAIVALLLIIMET
jgi:hypothetical protein